MKKTKAITLSAMMAALSVTLLLLGSVLEVLDLCTVMLASFCTLFVYLRVRPGYAWATYAVTAALALLLLPSKIVALEYLLFGGYYPILRAALARLRPLPALILKLLTFNAALGGLLLLFRFLFVAVETSLTLEVVTFLLGNVAFLLYDYVLGRISFMILYRIRPRFRAKNK